MFKKIMRGIGSTIAKTMLLVMKGIGKGFEFTGWLLSPRPSREERQLQVAQQMQALQEQARQRTNDSENDMRQLCSAVRKIALARVSGKPVDPELMMMLPKPVANWLQGMTDDERMKLAQCETSKLRKVLSGTGEVEGLPPLEAATAPKASLSQAPASLSLADRLAANRAARGSSKPDQDAEVAHAAGLLSA